MSLTQRQEEDDIESYEQARTRTLASDPKKQTFSVAPRSLRRYHYVVIKGRPCKIVDYSFSACSPRGHKFHVVAIDIFTGKKLEDICPAKHMLEAPVVTMAEYMLINIDGTILNLLTDDGESKDDVNLPDAPLDASIRDDFAAGKELRVVTVTAMGEEQVMRYKEVVD